MLKHLMNTIQTESKYSSGVYGKRDMIIVRGEGARVWDENGRIYIDCVGGIGVANVWSLPPGGCCCHRPPGADADHLPGNVLQRPARCVDGKSLSDFCPAIWTACFCVIPAQKQLKAPLNLRA